MLYKKYHRNYVSQFKKGTEFSYKTCIDRDTVRDIVKKEPYYNHGNIRILGIRYFLVLVYSVGTTNCNIKIEKDVV